MRKKVNKKIWISIFGFAIPVCLGLLSFAERGPRIKFAEESYYFGKIKQGIVATHIFVFRNTGDAPLKINNVDSSCGCTAGIVSKERVMPGEKGEIKVTFNSRGFRGKVTKYVHVKSNDPTQPVKQLSIRAEIEIPPQPKISLDRFSSDLGLILEGEEIETRRRITNKGELELRVSSPHKEVTFFTQGNKVTFPLKIPSGKSVEVEIRIPPKKKKGLVREYIRINSNDPHRKTLSFFLSAYIITKKQLKELFSKYKDVLD